MAAKAAESVHAQSRLVAKGEGKVAAAIRIKPGDMGGRHDGHDHGLGLGFREGRTIDGNNISVDAQAGGAAHADVQVRSAILDHGLQQLVHLVGHDLR